MKPPVDDDEEEDDDDVGPALPPGFTPDAAVQVSGKETDGSAPKGGEEDDFDEPVRLPVK